MTVLNFALRAVCPCVASCVASVVFAGCGDLAGADYRGESVLNLRGTVENPQALVVAGDDTTAYLLWLPTAEGESVIADETPVAPVFPADFQLDVLAPPPASVVGELDDGVRGAVGIVLFMTSAQKDTALAQINAGEDLNAGVVGLAQALVYHLDDEGSAANFGALDIEGNRAVVGFNILGVIQGECLNDDEEIVPCEGSGLVPNDAPVPVKLVDTDVVVGLTIGG